MEPRSDISNGLMTGFIDCNLESLEKYHPKLLVNDHKRGMKVLNNIIAELKESEEFYFSVAFITNSGVASLVSILDELKDKNIKGKIVTSQYQNFTQPVALERLLAFENIELRIVTDENFHAKGYIFKKSDNYTFIIGSSNLTQNALSQNKEWNLKLSSLEHGDIMHNIIHEFDWTFENAQKVTPEYIEEYSLLYNKIRIAQLKLENVKYEDSVLSIYRVLPNKMQKEALQALEDLRNEGKNKALLISATGTGKTYLSAFDVAQFGAKKFLFVVHRENIARAAMKSFKDVLGHSIHAAILGGGHKNLDADYIFATIQTLSKEHVLDNFSPDHFDYIVIDEAHRVGGGSYGRVLEKFKPKFLLGMSATPDRNDDFNVYKQFDNNVAYEIRLHKALEEQLVAPFHYYGIGALKINGTDHDIEDLQDLEISELAQQVVEKSDYYGCDHGRIKALVFCSTVQLAEALSNQFNLMNKAAKFLGGISSEEEREICIKRLEQDKPEGKLDYIFTVDIFNEGIDIPSVNQVIMLRPTQSAIIYIQQLGRGLRKTFEKEYLTVIDFVGNYSNNYMVPMALYGDRTYNKDNLRKLIITGSSTIPGASTINFDQISKKRIFESIDSANFSTSTLLKESYQGLRNLLGRIPELHEFEKYDYLDVVKIFENNNYKSYYRFLVKNEKDYAIRLTSDEELFVAFISRKLATGKKPHELILLQAILYDYEFPLENMILELHNKYKMKTDENTIISTINMMTGNFIAGSEGKIFKKCKFLDEYKGKYIVSDLFKKMLFNPDFKQIVADLVEFGIGRNDKNYNQYYKQTPLVLYQKYTYQEACRLLDWNKEVPGLNIGGYMYDSKTNTYPVFINYEKPEDVHDAINFHDRFETPSVITAISKSNRGMESNDIVRFQTAEQNHTRVELFVRKNKDDDTSKEFYYLGRLKPMDYKAIAMPVTEDKAVEILHRLETPVRQDLYEYIIGK